MARAYTAILHVRDIGAPALHDRVRASLGALRGVGDVRIEPREMLITVGFDHARTGLADIVRTVEDAGSVVASVAQRAGAPVALV